MTARGEVLVAIINNLPDMTLDRHRHWARIPSDSVSKFLKNSWPPQWLAFYQTKVFGSEAYAVNYSARVGTIREVCRWELFPDEPEDSKSQRRYYKLELSPLSRLEQPILSRRLRRITFIPTTWEKFTSASEINDLWDESPLEDRLAV